MDRQKEVVFVSAVLFGKYQLYGILGTGRAGTVFLAVHLGLEEYRAIKRVPKSFLKFEDLRREALVLKELRHPGIPIIYDVEEDESYSYLIEEYLEGESLYDLVKRQGHLSRELAISYGVQLTSIISYLHLAGPNPILHLDLQPKNLLLCHDTIKLIDFGLAASLGDANMPKERYGTVGCAAPEQYSKDGALDERTDIYAIGTIIHYLFTGVFPKLPYKPAASMDADLAAVIKRCIKLEKEERFSSAQELGERLRQLERMGTAAKERLQSSSLIIALAGSKSGAGTTHIGIGLSVYLRNHGYPNLFEEKNDSGMSAGLGGVWSAKRDQYGLMRYRGFLWKPYYGPGVKLREPPFQIRILDYGKNINLALTGGSHRVILVCDGSDWGRNSTFLSAEQVVKGRISYGIIYNHAAGKTRITLPDGAVPSKCLKAPYYPDPFEPGAEAEGFYKALLEEVLEIKIRRRGISGLKSWIIERLTGMIPGKGRTPGKR
ncbi:serine/threonine protein kinase [[Clostridium] saccharolyticum WM1]|uniref:Serine/threonine protein kinase n=1 Tax=Lacrimispora saccharolytica (strain ATCC 35040 / DSM 2544 / NRCC 2533 / WM1) TaxID=610130 RepID=D9R2X7_LACSW|nr:serine/threonine-protein kinase [Lacrimispora saccharolytica]ADL02967.1 serine/threonine protein kinase [[Clostridium] saccharolyticum WM1]